MYIINNALPQVIGTLIAAAAISLMGLYEAPQLALNGLVIRDGVADFLKTGMNFKTAVGPQMEAICEIKIASVVNNLVRPICSS